MILFFDTSENQNLRIALIQKQNIRDYYFLSSVYHSGNLLAMIDLVLKKNALSPAVLKGIAVVSGPGKFSALRTGITCANTLAWTLGIPVVGVKKIQLLQKHGLNTIQKIMAQAKKRNMVFPYYGKEPNITLSKK